MDTASKDTAGAQLKLVTNALPALVFQIDRDERCWFASQTYHRWFGRPADEARGQPLRQLLGDAICAAIEAPLRRALQGERVEFEARLGHPLWAEPRQIRATCTPCASGGAVKSPDSVLVMLEDVTLAEADRTRLVAQLTDTIRINDLFASILSHDLRNPLQSILTAAEILIRRAPEPKFASTASRIVASGNRMNRMIGQLVDLSRIRAAGAPALDRVPCDVATIFRQAIDQGAGTGAARVQLDCSGSTEGWWDPDRLAQVASTLVGNALTHGAPEGLVNVDIDGDDAALVTIHLHNLGAIPPDLLPKLFEPFQAGDRRGPRGDGVGLGLHIAQQIMTAHGGTIAATSAPDEGTEFKIRLPRHLGADGAVKS